MDTQRYANPDCRVCHGTGRARTGDRLSDAAICLCAIAGKRAEDAERIVSLRLPERARMMTLDNYETGDDPKNEQALTVSRNFVDQYEDACREGWLLGFWGLPASGKTHLVAGIAQACVRRYLARPYFFNVPTELRRERERFREQAQRRFQAGASDTPPKPSPIQLAINAELLVLDDLGAEYHRQGAGADEVSWVYEQLYTILEERIMGCRPTLFTSNFSPSDLERRLSNEAGRRVLSRIERSQVSPALEVVQVPGANRQSEKAAAKLFAAREPKEFEVKNRANKSRRRCTRAEMFDLVGRYRAQHGDDSTSANLLVRRVLRKDEPVSEAVDLAKVMDHLDKAPDAATAA